ncbi:hypothetical protein BDY21DRAFT_333280 [Lineolata rhizophorae]|uniref:Uncharacterized protein n=1 Tax=Lineolata rhizophorae TaxID=578093 RepID=A0A6A6PA23_9PEZI|nr:hypothetical protein BDY21DRAFT_333280 [Lineolata rhizophorae]
MAKPAVLARTAMARARRSGRRRERRAGASGGGAEVGRGEADAAAVEPSLYDLARAFATHAPRTPATVDEAAAPGPVRALITRVDSAAAPRGGDGGDDAGDAHGQTDPPPPALRVPAATPPLLTAAAHSSSSSRRIPGAGARSAGEPKAR